MTPPFYNPAFDVRISGVALSADVTRQVISLQYDNNLDLADMFTLVLRNADNELLDSALFDLGKSVEIHLGYGDQLEPMMLGEITAIEPSFPEDGPPTLRIRGYDRSYRLRNTQGDRSFQWVPDSLIAAQMAVEAGLIPVVDPSPVFHRKKITQSSSDMAFLKERARANFFDVFVHWDKLYFQFPRPQTEAVVLEWGRNLSSYAPRLSIAGLAGVQVIRGYSEELAHSIVAFAMAPDLSADGLLERAGSQLEQLLLTFGRRVARTHSIESPVDALVLAKALLQEILEGLYEGTGSCIGLPALRAGQMIEVRGVGRRFSGTYRLRKVTHTVSDAGYRTTFEVSQRSGAALLSLVRKALNEGPKPDGNQPYYGVAVAKVVANHVDPTEGAPMARVKVTFPWLSDTVESGWVRTVAPGAGARAGLYWVPDVGDEVLVAFEHGDVSKPIVLGGLWNGTHPPPAANTDALNRKRVLATPAGHTLSFDDTPGTGAVRITHAAGSEIVLSGDGSVTISAARDLTLKARTSINLAAPAVDIKVTTSVNIH